MTDSSDAATGLPPLSEVDRDIAILLVAWDAQVGVVLSPSEPSSIPVRWLSVRGLIRNGDGVEWAQVHIAVPVEHAVDVAAALATGAPDGAIT